MSLLSSLLEREPSPPQPIMVEKRQLRILGKLRGHEWATVAGQDAEFEVLSDTRPIPDRMGIPLSPGELYLQDDREWTDGRGRKALERVWIPTKRHPRGTFANGGRAPAAPKAKRTKPLRSIDALAVLPALAARQAQIVSYLPEKDERIEPIPPGVDAESVMLPKLPRSTGTLMTADRRPVRGVSAILGVLNRAGVTLQPDRHHCHLDVQSPGGALATGGRELIAVALPLLNAALGATSAPPVTDGRLPCHSVVHRDAAPEAVTLGAGGMPACGECVG